MTSLIFINTSIFYLSLKYVNNYYELISDVSKWIYFELEKYNYKESKFIKSLNKKDLEIIKTLIKFNKNIDLLSKYLTDSDLYRDNLIDIVKLLIDNGADVQMENNAALIYASNYNQSRIIKLLIDNGADIHINDDELLIWTSINGDFEVVKLLIDNGADIHMIDDIVLRFASNYGHLDVVKLLVENGANIHANDDEALKTASINNHFEVVNYLKSHL